MTITEANMRSVQRDQIAELDSFVKELGKETERGKDVALGTDDDLSKQAGQRQEDGMKCALLREHLESARVYLIGLMPTEYALSLKMAEESLDCVSDTNLRNRIEEFIHRA
jgi:hypothetical protein